MGKKKQHGGKRVGAGRPPANPEGATVPIAASVPSTLIDGLDAYAERKGWNRSQAITEAIRMILAKR